MKEVGQGRGGSLESGGAGAEAGKKREKKQSFVFIFYIIQADGKQRHLVSFLIIIYLFFNLS